MKTLHSHGIWIISEGPNFLASCWTQSALTTQRMHRRYINIISNVNGICLGFSSIDEYSQLLPSKGRISCNQFIRFPVGVAYDIVHSPRDTAWKSEHWALTGVKSRWKGIGLCRSTSSCYFCVLQLQGVSRQSFCAEEKMQLLHVNLCFLMSFSWDNCQIVNQMLQWDRSFLCLQTSGGFPLTGCSYHGYCGFSSPSDVVPASSSASSFDASSST